MADNMAPQVKMLAAKQASTTGPDLWDSHGIRRGLTSGRLSSNLYMCSVVWVPPSPNKQINKNEKHTEILATRESSLYWTGCTVNKEALACQGLANAREHRTEGVLKSVGKVSHNGS